MISPLQAIRVEHCERVHVITAAKRICIANCRECAFFLGVNQQPLIVGDNHKLQVGVSLFTSIGPRSCQLALVAILLYLHGNLQLLKVPRVLFWLCIKSYHSQM